jgi:hypothetical protein
VTGAARALPRLPVGGLPTRQVVAEDRTVIGQASAAAVGAHRATSALANACPVPAQVRASAGVPAARRAAMNCSMPPGEGR